MANLILNEGQFFLGMNRVPMGEDKIYLGRANKAFFEIRKEFLHEKKEGFYHINNKAFCNALVVSLLKDPFQAIYVFFVSEGKLVAHEALEVDASVAQKTFDFLTAQEYLYGVPKVAHIAIFTHVHNESSMLKMWQDFYSNLVPLECLYVIDDGSTDDGLNYLSNKVNVVRIPKGPLDHWNMAAYCSHFQRFLLQRYKWVISTDCDELLFFPCGISDYLDRYSQDVVMRPEFAIAPVHVREIEPPFDFVNSGGKINSRKLFVDEGEMFLKPLIANMPVTWLPGFHQCRESASVGEGVLLVHTRMIDWDRLVASLSMWAKHSITEQERTTCRKVEDSKTSSSLEEPARNQFAEYLSRPSFDFDKLPMGLREQLFL